MSNIEPFDTRSFPLGKVCVRARSKFENVIFCSNQSQILGNTRRTFNVYLMNMFECVRISNSRWSSCSKILENRRSYSLDTRKICVRHNTCKYFCNSFNTTFLPITRWQNTKTNKRNGMFFHIEILRQKSTESLQKSVYYTVRREFFYTQQ